ncbi:MAG TPA: type II secretion system protein [Verrucomicrobiae bacterium]|nr:type II secretion system protein [Verrucomicrobiae bacterium]
MNTNLKKSGFTLIELLVVIAIIAILASMLLPVLAKAKARAQEIACVSNMRQWGMAQTLYVDDSDGLFPFPRYQSNANPADQDNPVWSDIASYHYNVHPAVGNDVWFNVLPPYVSSRPLYEWALAQYKPTFNSLNSDGRNIFICPTTVSQGIDHNDLSPTHGNMQVGQRPLFSYGMNSKSTANESLAANSPTNLICRATMVRNPSAFVLFSDVRNRSAESPYYATPDNSSPSPSPANWLMLATPHCYTTRFSSRHSKGGNITFSDGHAAYFKYDYVVADGIKTAADGSGATPIAGHDPGEPDLKWDANGVRVP